MLVRWNRSVLIFSRCLSSSCNDLSALFFKYHFFIHYSVFFKTRNLRGKVTRRTPTKIFEGADMANQLIFDVAPEICRLKKRHDYCAVYYRPHGRMEKSAMAPLPSFIKLSSPAAKALSRCENHLTQSCFVCVFDRHALCVSTRRINFVPANCIVARFDLINIWVTQFWCHFLSLLYSLFYISHNFYSSFLCDNSALYLLEEGRN